MMHSGDNPGSISERDLRVTASQQFFADLDAREATRGEVTFEELDRRYADPISREEAVALRPFFEAFCDGRSVFRYECKMRHGRPMHVWQAIHEFDLHDSPLSLSLSWRDDDPFAEQI
jgi:hypothetical protein